jgi:hypothetical protein
MVITNGTTVSNPWFLTLDFDPSQDDNLPQMIYPYFELGNPSVHCASPTCGGIRQHYDYLRFEAAPQVLRIYVRLFGHQGGMSVELCQPFDVPETLDFTFNQRYTDLPLTYTLNSCIAQGGGDGHVERGLQGSCEDEHRFSAQAAGPATPSAIPLPQPNNGTGNFTLGPAPAHPVPQVPQATLAAHPTNTTINNESDQMINVRGRVNHVRRHGNGLPPDVQRYWHVSDACIRRLANNNNAEFVENSQLPQWFCGSIAPQEYNVYLLTYTRDALKGAARKKQSMISGSS